VLEALVQPSKDVEDEDSVFNGAPRSARPSLPQLGGRDGVKDGGLAIGDAMLV
jgi:hypothetical protein